MIARGCCCTIGTLGRQKRDKVWGVSKVLVGGTGRTPILRAYHLAILSWPLLVSYLHSPLQHFPEPVVPLFFILLHSQHPSCSVLILKHFFSPLILNSCLHHLFVFLYSSCFYPTGSYHFFDPPSKYLSFLFVSIFLCSTNSLFTHILFIPQILLFVHLKIFMSPLLDS
jgi:hypothetical protein